MMRESNGPGRAKLAQDELRVGLALDENRVEGVDPQATESFEDLICQHRDPLYSEALRLTDDWTAAEDLVQDTLECAYRAFHRYHHEGKARAWLGCIMRNLWITERRRRRGAVRTASLDGAEAMTFDGHAVDASSTSDVETEVLGQLGAASIIRAIDDLPRHHRQVVILAGLRGVPYGTIAETLVVPVGTVASRLSRARRRLLELLQDQDSGIHVLAKVS